MTITSRAIDKDLLADLADVLQISKNNLRKDPCGDWTIVGRRGHVLTDGLDIYVYLPSGTARRWEAAKRVLSFMTVTQDGDEEGILKMRGAPTAEQAVILRKLLGSRYAPPLTEEERAARIRRLTSPCKPPPQAPVIALSAPPDICPHPEPQNAKSASKPPVEAAGATF
jgi:hypothetical protein